MADLWFFISYARFDRDTDPFNSISRFYADLDTRVRLKKVIKDGHGGFYDDANIQQGDAWPPALVKALGTCRAMICMYSPGYFSSDYCGRELEIFRRRLIDHAAGSQAVGDWPPLILPLMLDPPQDLEHLPEAISDIQIDDSKYPRTLEADVAYSVVPQV